MTTYRDEMHVCEGCGKSFVFTVEEQRAQEQLGLPVTAPTYCPQCRKAAPPQPGLHPGVVKWYNSEKAYGFLTRAEGGEIFFHKSGVTGDPETTLREGAQVWYEVQETERGLQAYNVHER